MARIFSLVPNDMLNSFMSKNPNLSSIDNYIMNTAKLSMNKILGSKKHKSELSRQQYLAQLHNLRKIKTDVDTRPIKIDIDDMKKISHPDIVHQSPYGLESEVPISSEGIKSEKKIKKKSKIKKEIEKEIPVSGEETYVSFPEESDNEEVELEHKATIKSAPKGIVKRSSRSTGKKLTNEQERELLKKLSDEVESYIYSNEKQFGVAGNRILNNKNTPMNKSDVKNSIDYILRGRIGANIEGANTPGTAVFQARFNKDPKLNSLIEKIISDFQVGGGRGRKPKPKIEKRGRPKSLYHPFRRQVWKLPKR